VDPIEVVLRFAKSQLYVREIGANAGQVVEEYQRTTGNKPPDSWCASFVSWCGKHALEGEWPVILSAGCQALYLDAKAKGIVRDAPKKGDVFLQWHDDLGRYAHTGFVADATGINFTTIEGNTNPNGGREGYGVFQRQRVSSQKYRFIRWAKV
jgi:hypothetical protein